MCEGDRNEVTKGVYYLTLHQPKQETFRLPSTAELAELRLNEAIELEYELDSLIQATMLQRVNRSN